MQGVASLGERKGIEACLSMLKLVLKHLWKVLKAFRSRCEIRGGALRERIRIRWFASRKPFRSLQFATSLKFSCYKESAKKHNKAQSGGRFHPVEVVDEWQSSQKSNVFIWKQFRHFDIWWDAMTYDIFWHLARLPRTRTGIQGKKAQRWLDLMLWRDQCDGRDLETRLEGWIDWTEVLYLSLNFALWFCRALWVTVQGLRWTPDRRGKTLGPHRIWSEQKTQEQ